MSIKVKYIKNRKVFNRYNQQGFSGFWLFATQSKYDPSKWRQSDSQSDCDVNFLEHTIFRTAIWLANCRSLFYRNYLGHLVFRIFWLLIMIRYEPLKYLPLKTMALNFFIDLGQYKSGCILALILFT